MKALTTSAVVLLALAVASCGGSQSPTAPTPPPVAVAPPPAPAARLVAVDTLTMISCINGLCSFRGAVRNEGDACAHDVTGESWITSAQGVEVGRARWSLPNIVIRPGQSVFYLGDGMPQAVLNHLDGNFQANFLFNSGSC